MTNIKEIAQLGEDHNVDNEYKKETYLINIILLSILIIYLIELIHIYL